jgi:hypothetical protein
VTVQSVARGDAIEDRATEESWRLAMKVKLPGAVESQCRSAPALAGHHTNRLAPGHATADRVAIGVISLTGGRT